MDGTSGFQRRDLICIALVMLFGLAVKGWLFVRTEVLARDGVGYVRYAARLGQEPWAAVLRSEQQHPLYPVSILGVHHLLTSLGAVASESGIGWQSAAQVANLLAGLLLIGPMYLLARWFFDSRVAFWSALTFQVLPVPAQVTSDALSEGVFLLAAALALLFLAAGLERRSPGWFLAAGFASGCAYLTRPEAVVIVLLGLLSLVIMQAAPTWRMAWVRAGVCGSMLLFAAGIVALPYWMTIGGLSNKPSSLEFFKPIQDLLTFEPVAPSPSGSLLLASRFTDGVDGRRLGDVGPLYAAGEVLDEVCKAFNYSVWIPVVLGLPWYGRRLLRSPGLLLLALTVVTQLLILWLLAYRVRYVSERHALLVVLCGCVFGMATLFHWAKRLPIWWQASPFPRWFTFLNRFMEPRRLGSGMEIAFVLAIVVGLTQTLKVPHQHRIGHKLAGLWLGQQLRPEDKLVDPYGWAVFYAGRFLPPPDGSPSPALASKGRRFIVVEPADPDLHRQRLVAEELARIAPAEVVFTWPEERQPELLVYAGVKRRAERQPP